MAAVPKTKARQRHGSSGGGEHAAWLTATQQALVDRALEGVSGNSSAAAQEARQRSKLLSTSADKHGVSFAGGHFQAEYIRSKFQLRAELVLAILCKAELELGGSLQVVSCGSGPGCDAAGVLSWARGRAGVADIELHLLDYETSWKRYLCVLERASAGEMPAVSFQFHPCDVRQGIFSGDKPFAQPNLPLLAAADAYDWETGAPIACDGVELRLPFDLYLFSYVVNETSGSSGEMQFYRDLGGLVKPGAVFVFADVRDLDRKKDGCGCALDRAIDSLRAGMHDGVALESVFTSENFSRSKVRVLRVCPA